MNMKKLLFCIVIAIAPHAWAAQATSEGDRKVQAAQQESITATSSSLTSAKNKSQRNLFLATGANDQEHVIDSLNQGADINATDATYRRTALAIAAGKGYKDLVELLLARNADADKADANGFTPLMHSIINQEESEEQKQIIELLIKHTKNIKHQSIKGLTALDIATLFRNIFAMKRLFDAINHDLSDNELEKLHQYRIHEYGFTQCSHDNELHDSRGITSRMGLCHQTLEFMRETIRKRRVNEYEKILTPIVTPELFKASCSIIAEYCID